MVVQELGEEEQDELDADPEVDEDEDTEDHATPVDKRLWGAYKLCPVVNPPSFRGAQ